MAGQTVKSALAQKLGKRLDDAVRKHADDETDYGFSPIPPGVNGIARLIKCRFRKYEPGSNMKRADGKSAVGEDYLFFQAVIVEPRSVVYKDQEVVVAGKQPMQSVPTFDTKKGDGTVVTLEDHVDRMMNEMRKLGGPEFTKGAGGGDLEGLAAALEEQQPYFHFVTSESKPQIDPKTGKPKINPVTKKPYEPRIWENWNGNQGLENYAPPDANVTGVEDNTTKGGPSANGATSAHGKTENASASEGGEYRDDMDLDSLLSRATDGEGDDAAEAMNRLIELAVAAGHPQEKAEAADVTWADVVDMIRNPVTEGDDGAKDDTTPEEVTWKKGDVCRYTVIDPKTKKPVVNPKTKKPNKPVECEVVAVDPKKKTATLKSLEDGKTTYPGVAWDVLETPG